MPRKSNKTDHVLNLIAGGDSTDGSPEENPAEEVLQEETPAPPAKKTPAKSTRGRKKAKPETPSNIKIMDDPNSPADPLSLLIRDSLEKELQQVEVISPPVHSNPAVQEMTVTQETAPPPVVPEKTAPPAPVKDEPLGTATDLIEESAPGDDYLFINVMESLVEENLNEYMNRFHVCTCKRCALDIKALSLSRLPSKYLVAVKAKAPLLMTHYKNAYSAQIMTELTRACLEVLDAPRHE